MSDSESYLYRERQCASQSTDEDLIRLVRQGETSAFEMLVKRYEMPLFNYIARMIGSRSEAEDLFQETFLRVYKHLDRFRTTGRFRPWVYRIATNLCKDHIKYRSRHRTVSLDKDRGGSESSSRLVDRIADRNPSPSDQARESELAGLLETAIGCLSAKHRSVFLMARYEGLSYDDIAHALGIPLGTVKSRMNKAVHFLLNRLGEVTQ